MGAQVLLQQGSGPEGSRQSIARGPVADGRERWIGKNHRDPLNRYGLATEHSV